MTSAIIAGIIVAALGVCGAFAAARRNAADGKSAFRGRPPEALGVPSDHPARTVAERLEASLGGDFESRVKERVVRSRPGLKDGEWDWIWFELKRFFLMSGIARSVPMYSGRIDEAWHEMLMFTREYEQFCQNFCGAMIHHAPHTAGTEPDRSERAWFDWIYGELFPPSPASARLWGPFFRTALRRELIERLEAADRTEWLAERFRGDTAARHEDIAAVIDYLIGRFKEQAAAARRNAERRSEPASGDAWTVGAMSGFLVYASLVDYDGFQERMNERLHDRRNDGTGGCGSWSGPVVGEGGKAHGGDKGAGGNGDHGGGDGGSSCGSSCGSGCSS
jgi:hypothetical protein